MKDKPKTPEPLEVAVKSTATTQGDSSQGVTMDNETKTPESMEGAVPSAAKAAPEQSAGKTEPEGDSVPLAANTEPADGSVPLAAEQEPEAEEGEFLERASQAVAPFESVPLNEFVLESATYSHRDPSEFTVPTSTEQLRKSIMLEGLQSPIEYYVDKNKRKVPIKGHRRITALRYLVDQGTPGFTADMPIPSVEVKHATDQDRICRSVSDNANRNGYTPIEQIRAAKVLHDANVEIKRSASALNMTPTQYSRILRIAQTDWMFDYVIADVIAPTNATHLLLAADKHGRLEDLKNHLKHWVDVTKATLDKKPNLIGNRAGKEIKLKSLLKAPLVAHWEGLLRSNEPLNDNLHVKRGFAAQIDPETNTVIFHRAEVDLAKAPLTEIAEGVVNLELIRKVMLGYLTSRNAVEGPQGPQVVARKENERLDLSVLRDAGLAAFADELEKQYAAEKSSMPVEDEVEGDGVVAKV